MSLKGRVALVTGASSEIGGEVALLLARQGAHVAIGYRSNKVGAQRISRASEAAAVKIFLSKEASFLSGQVINVSGGWLP